MARAKYLIVVGGPTASGKSEMAVRLARHFQTGVLSCDSRQFYRELHIGTARPPPDTLRRAPHHFIGNRSVNDPYSVGEYVREALQVLEKIYRDGDFAILAGGSGLYQKALCEGIDEFPKVPRALRERVEADLQREGLEALQRELARTDPAYYEEVDLSNPARLVRAIAVIRSSGRPFSAFRRGQRAPRPFRPIYLWLDRPRSQLYARIERRVDTMMARGLLDEARALLPQCHLDALRTVGYQELFAFLDGGQTLESAVSDIKRNTRRYAKRQITWRRRDGHWMLIDPDGDREALAYVDLAVRHGVGLRTQRWNADILALTRDGEDLARMRLRSGGKMPWMAGPWPGREVLPSEWLDKLMEQAYRRLPAGEVFAASGPGGKPFLRQAGFESVDAVPSGLLAQLNEAEGRLPPRWSFFSKAK